MEDFQDYGIPFERNFFLSRAKASPVFLLQHIAAFSSVILDRCKTKYFHKVRGRHRGTKSRPAWLRALCLVDSKIDFSELVQRVPQRSFEAVDFGGLPSIEMVHLHLNPQPADAENYFAQFRWSELTDEILNASKPRQWSLPKKIEDYLYAQPEKSDAAWETYSTCERVANLLTWMTFIPVEQRVAVLPPVIQSFLEESVQWVLKHLEYYGKKTGNHILNNARCLIMAGAVLNNAHAIKTGILILTHMLPVLIQRDGFLRERSSHYQLIVFGWLLDANYFLQTCKGFDTVILNKTLEEMHAAARMLCNKRGYLYAHIGDVSPDHTSVKTSQRLMRCYPEWWPSTELDTPEIQARDDWWVLNSQQNKVILNCPPGKYPKKISSHAHNDMTSFVWTYAEDLILTDSGRSRYTKDPVSTMQKSARGHNVAFVNGFAPLCESLVINGNWWPSPYADAFVQVDKILDNAISISHNGFARATPVKRHQRKITLENNQVCIDDEFTGVGKVAIELLWQLNPTFFAWRQDAFSFTNGNIEVSIDLSSLRHMPVVQYHSQSAARGWYSGQYGVACPHPVITMRWEVNLPFTTRVIFKAQPCVE